MAVRMDHLMGTMKSRAPEIIRDIVVETLRDGYASLAALPAYSNIIRKDDCARDVEYLRRRAEAEGLPLFTTTLPTLGDFIDEYVRGDKVERVVGFKPYNGLFPVFLRPFWCLLKDIREGQSDPKQLQVYRILRTLCFGCKKLETPYTDEQTLAKLRSFLGIEKSMREGPGLCLSPALHRGQLAMDLLLDDYEPSCESPRHGPGAVAGGERHNGKWVWTHFYASVDREWPYREYLFPVREVMTFRRHYTRIPGEPLYYSENVNLQWLEYMIRGQKLVTKSEPTARMLFVPKDSRGPRIISCEPKELMYLQQGVSNHLVKYVEWHNMTRGHVNFDDQEVNGRLAQHASIYHDWSTIDLSDASDRVSNALVRFLVPERVWKKWNALRSTHTILPNGMELPLKKFASMGSAMCFPVESLVFWALCVGAAWERSGSLASACEGVYVFGDDIIVKDEYTDAVLQALDDANLVVNNRKSFVGQTDFRESCGIDAFRGEDVTPFRIRKQPPLRPSDGTGIAAYVKYAENSQYVCKRRSDFLIRVVETLVGPVPRVPIPQSFLSMVTKDNVWSIDDYHRPTWDYDSCYYKSRLIAITPKRMRSPISGWQRLQKALSQRILSDPTEVVDRASTQIRRRSLPITYLELKPA